MGRVVAKSKICLSVFLVLVGVAGTYAKVEAHSEEAAVAVRTYDPISVDGDLSDWIRRFGKNNWTAKIEIAKGNTRDWMAAPVIHVNTATSNVEAGEVSSSADLSANVYLMWDADDLYVAAFVDDDSVISQHKEGDIWQDDALELWFDCRHDAVTDTLFQDDEYQLGFSPSGPDRAKPVAWAWRNSQADAVIKAMRMASVVTDGGYVIEASVPWAVLNGCQNPTKGKLMGFNISIVDKDADQVWTHLVWSGSSHASPSQFGHLYLEDAPINVFDQDMLAVPKEQLVDPFAEDSASEPGSNE